MPSLRGARAALALAAAAMTTALAAAGAHAQPREPGAPMAIAAPHYGDVLFHFYQDRTFTALTGLMVSQHAGRIAPHDDEAEVLRGGLLLSYGLHDEAGAVFARLIDRNTTPAVRDRAWYFLAKLRHQRGLHRQAEAALAQVAGPLPGTLEDDRQLLHAQLLMVREDYAGAAARLVPLKASGSAGFYARFNLGVALVRMGRAAEGRALLAEVGRAPAPSEELRSLRDRANVALGFTALQARQPREARIALERVRLNAAQSNKALLGFGWAAAELGDPRLALVPWTELAARPGNDAAVLEARIAVPYAYAEVGAFAGALQRYEAALEGFAAESRALAESIEAVKAGRLVQALLDANNAGIVEGAAPALDARRGIGALPPAAALPHPAHLLPLLADHPFQEAFKNLRDLRFLADNLARWQQSLAAFDHMLATRRAAYAERLPRVRERAAGQDIAGLQARHDVLADTVARAEREADAAAFADDAERALLERVQRSRATLDKAATRALDDPTLVASAERLRRVAGALTWQLAQAQPGRAWAAKKALRQTDAAMAEARARDAALAHAQAEEPARFDAFAARIAALGQRLAGLQPRLAAVGDEQQAVLNQIVMAELQAQQERLATYAAQARLAIAQIHDKARAASADTLARVAPAEATR
jgi:hypothetical protein